MFRRERERERDVGVAIRYGYDDNNDDKHGSTAKKDFYMFCLSSADIPIYLPYLGLKMRKKLIQIFICNNARRRSVDSSSPNIATSQLRIWVKYTEVPIFEKM